MMKTILVVDDDSMFRNIMKHHLTKMGFTVIENDSGRGVTAQIQEHEPLACLVDLVMDDKEGIETIADIRKDPQPPKIIAVSSNAYYLDLAESLGADTSLTKPVSPEALKAALRTVGIEEPG